VREAAKRAGPGHERAHALLGRIDGCTGRLLAAGRDVAALPPLALRVLQVAARGEQVPPPDLACALATAGALGRELTRQTILYCNPHSRPRPQRAAPAGGGDAAAP
jgi:hypothetical protein